MVCSQVKTKDFPDDRDRPSKSQKESGDKNKQKKNDVCVSLTVMKVQQDIAPSMITCIISLNAKTLALGCENGSIVLYYMFETDETRNKIVKNKAHLDMVTYLCTLPHELFASCSLDQDVNIWSISNNKELTLIHNIVDSPTPLDKLIHLSSFSQFASCSSESNIIYIWKDKAPFELQKTIEEKSNVCCIIQLKSRDKSLVTSCFSKEDSCEHYLGFWKGKTFSEEPRIPDIMTCSTNGLIELPNDRIAVLDNSDERVSRIQIVDVVMRRKIQIVNEPQDVEGCGALFQFNNNALIYAYEGDYLLLNVSNVDNNNHSNQNVIECSQNYSQEFDGKAGFVLLGKYVFTSNNNNGVTTIEYKY